MSEIRVEKISFSYNSTGQKTLEDISFSLEKASFTAILGPNGAGKSTLLKLLLAILKPAEGELFLRGQKLSSYSTKERARIMAYLPQNSRAMHLIEVSEVVLMGRFPWQKRWSYLTKADRRAFERAVELTSLGELLNRSYAELSGGERQRVLLARALCQDTAWLMLDEAANNLDLAYQIEIFELLKKLQREEGISILAIMHDLNLAARYADKSILLKAGRLFQGPDSAEPFSEKRLSELYNLDLDWIYSAGGQRHLVWK